MLQRTEKEGQALLSGMADGWREAQVQTLSVFVASGQKVLFPVNISVFVILVTSFASGPAV